jgi:hypothetical protein
MLSLLAKTALMLGVGIAGDDVLHHRQALGPVPFPGLLGHDVEAAGGKAGTAAVGPGLAGGLGDDTGQDRHVGAGRHLAADVLGGERRAGLVVGADVGDAGIGALGVHEDHRHAVGDGFIHHRGQRIGVGRGQDQAVDLLDQLILDLGDLGGDV